jgi:hypothetical protein
MRDQVERCEVDIKPDNSGFTVKSEITVPIKKGGVQGEEIATVKITLYAEVDSKTGNAQVKVQRSNLAFKEGVSDTDKKNILSALDAPLPQTALPPSKMTKKKTAPEKPTTPEKTSASERPSETVTTEKSSAPDLKTLISEQKEWDQRAVFENKALFQAVTKFAETKYMGETPHFIRDAYALIDNETDPVVFKEQLGKIFENYLTRESPEQLNISYTEKSTDKTSLPAELKEILEKEPFDMEKAKELLGKCVDEACDTDVTWKGTIIKQFGIANGFPAL